MTAQKAALRVAAAARRATLPAEGAGEALAGHVLHACPPSPGAVVAGYWPMGSEMDVRPLMLTLVSRGHVVVLPEVTPKGQPLVFRRWQPGDTLLPGRWNTVHPPGSVMVPQFLLVPLLAFDQARNRLGYGGGYYDRTLAALPGAVTVGCAFAGQQVERVPTEPHDRVLDRVATEAGVI